MSPLYSQGSWSQGNRMALPFSADGSQPESKVSSQRAAIKSVSQPDGRRKRQGSAYSFLLWSGSSPLTHIQPARTWSHGSEKEDGKCNLLPGSQAKTQVLFH